MGTQPSAVQAFLAQLHLTHNTLCPVVDKLYDLTKAIYPTISEQIKYGGIFFGEEGEYGGIFVYKTHVTFEFSNGVSFDDPDKILEGSGKFRRHLKCTSVDDIEAKQFLFFLKQCAK